MILAENCPLEGTLGVYRTINWKAITFEHGCFINAIGLSSKTQCPLERSRALFDDLKRFRQRSTTTKLSVMHRYRQTYTNF